MRTHIHEELTLKINTRYLIRDNLQNMVIQVLRDLRNIRMNESL